MGHPTHWGKFAIFDEKQEIRKFFTNLNLVDLCVEAKLGNGIVCRKYDYIFLFLKIHGSLRATQFMRDGVLKKVSLALVVA